MDGRPVRSARSKSNIQEKSQAKTVNQSKTAVVVNQQKIWNSEDDKIRSEADQDTDDVHAPRVGLNWKIVEANRAQPLVSTLIPKIITLKYETNVLLEAQSTPQPPSSEEPNTEEILTVPEVETAANTWGFAYNSTIPQVLMTSRLKPRSIYKRRAVSNEINTRSRQMYGSSKSDSSDDDVDYVTGNSCPKPY